MLGLRRLHGLSRSAARFTLRLEDKPIQFSKTPAATATINDAKYGYDGKDRSLPVLLASCTVAALLLGGIFASNFAPEESVVAPATSQDDFRAALAAAESGSSRGQRA